MGGRCGEGILVMTAYYGRAGEAGAEAGLRFWEITPEHILMDGPPPSAEALARADGSWQVILSPDLALVEVENLVAMFPFSYGYVLERLGLGDIV